MEPDLPQRRQGAKGFHSWSLSRSLIMGISPFQWFQLACPEFNRRVQSLRSTQSVPVVRAVKRSVAWPRFLNVPDVQGLAAVQSSESAGKSRQGVVNESFIR